MKTNALSLLALTGALFLMAACASEETNNKQEQAQKPDTKGLTAFTVDGGATRTTAEYDGSGLNFYWTQGDHLWVNNGTLIQDNSNNISTMLVRNLTTPGGVYRATTAKFYFAGTYTAPSYPVRYTGKGSTVGNKVTIKAQQSQTIPNDASHIGESGDCGTGTAIYSGTGYNFTLDHKASYVTFIPYSTQKWAQYENTNVLKIRVFTGNASDALAGTFNFADDGTLSNPASTSNSIELSINYLPIPNKSTVTTKTATMVVNPGTYNNVSIEYTLYDPSTNMTGTITKTYPSMTFTAGKNKKVHTNLQVKEYSGGYPRLWDETVAAGCPNVNEACWYAMKGDPHWDATTLWTMNDHLYVRGMWFKKKAKISGFTNSNYGGTDYRTTITNRPSNIVNNSITQGKPSNLNDYFFLPACGYYYNYGWTLLSFDHGYYWASPPAAPGYSDIYYYMSFAKDGVFMEYEYYGHGMHLWTAE